MQVLFVMALSEKTMKTNKMLDFEKTLEKMNEIHQSKNEDYATSGSNNPFYNFDFTKFVLQQFDDDRDKVFVWPIANKLARLAITLRARKINHESVTDSLIDIANYVVIWKCDIERREK